VLVDRLRLRRIDLLDKRDGVFEKHDAMGLKEGLVRQTLQKALVGEREE
jgi:hypothetical protein